MAHPEQKEFCLSVRDRFPSYFQHRSVLDVGSLDINGNNRYLFNNCNYKGIDLGPGNNVDIVCPIHQFKTKEKFDVIISTEMLEHDRYYLASMKAILTLLKPKGLLIITAAFPGRIEHGTKGHEPEASPFTNEFYQNITPGILNAGLNFERNFSEWNCRINYKVFDIYFCGIKK